MADRDLAHTAADGIHAAATEKQRIRFRATVQSLTYGYSGRYRALIVLLQVEPGTHVRVTCAQSARLAQVGVGVQVDVACTLTGMLDLTENTFVAERARELS